MEWTTSFIKSRTKVLGDDIFGMDWGWLPPIAVNSAIEPVNVSVGARDVCYVLLKGVRVKEI